MLFFFRQNSKFLWLNKQSFYWIFCSFTLLVRGKKNILSNLTNSQEPEPFFWPLGAGAAWEKNQELESEPLEKKIRSQSRSLKRLAGSPSLIIIFACFVSNSLFVTVNIMLCTPGFCRHLRALLRLWGWLRQLWNRGGGVSGLRRTRLRFRVGFNLQT